MRKFVRLTTILAFLSVLLVPGQGQPVFAHDGVTGGSGHAGGPLPNSTGDPLQLLTSFHLHGGYVSAGVAMRNRGFGTITLSGIPQGSTVNAAYLYWDVLGNAADPTFSSGALNGQAIAGSLFASGGDPCWGNAANFAYLADVTNLVNGNGSYALSGFASGITDGRDPWTALSYSPPMAEGASLVVIYANPTSPMTQVLLYQGATEFDQTAASLTITGFTAPQTVIAASTTFIGADGQSNISKPVSSFNGTSLPSVAWVGSDPQAGPDYSNGDLWDTMTADVTALVQPGDTSAIATANGTFPGGPSYDCLVWVAQVFSVVSDVVIPGTDWLGGQGVNVCWPETGDGTNYCGAPPWNAAVGTFGWSNPWQCVELAQRLYLSRQWYTASGGIFPNIVSAYQIYDWAAGDKTDFAVTANDTPYPLLAPGDMIITNSGGDAGHVAIVDTVALDMDGSGTIYAVEQNNSRTGRAAYSITAGGDITRAGDARPILGLVHAKRNTSVFVWPTLGATLKLDNGSQLMIPPSATLVPELASLTALSQSQLPDPIPTGWVLVGQGAAASLPALQPGSSAQLTFPYDPTSIPRGYNVGIFQDGDWTRLPSTFAGNTISAQVTASTSYAVLAEPVGATYVSLTPARILDSRSGIGLSGTFSSHVARTFQVTGVGGVPSGATAVTGNLTVTLQTSLGFLYLGPVAQNNPTSSTLNFPTGDDRANGVTVALGAGGTLSATYAAPTLGPTAAVIFDVTGYFVH